MSDLVVMKKVITYNNVGHSKNEFETSASTWGELRQELDGRGIRYAGMSVVEGMSNMSYEVDSAVLPTQDFVLFLLPKQVKSGSKEMDESAGLIDKDGGITWDEVDWADPSTSIESYSFNSHTDLAIARARKASIYLNALATFLEEKEAGQHVYVSNEEDDYDDEEDEENEEMSNSHVGFVQPSLPDELRVLHEASLLLQRKMSC